MPQPLPSTGINSNPTPTSKSPFINRTLPLIQTVVTGVMLAWNHYDAVHNGSVSMMILFLFPMLFLLGLGGLIDPRITFTMTDKSKSTPFFIRFVGGFLVIAGLSASAYLALVVYALQSPGRPIPPEPTPQQYSPSTSVIGTWTESMPVPEGEQPKKATVKFMPDGTEEQVLETNGKVYHIKGTYTIQDKILTEVPVSEQEDGQDIPIPDPSPKRFKFGLYQDKLYMTPLDTNRATLELTQIKE